MQQITSYLGFAIKSNSIIKGLDDILVTRKRIFLLLATNKMSENSEKKINKYKENNNIPLIIIDEAIMQSLNLMGVKILGITDPNLAKAIIAVNDKKLEEKN